MKRKDLEHLIRAASAVTNSYEVYVVGSQSILGQLPDAPEDLLVSSEADIFIREDDTLSDVIDGALGEGSPFHDRFGYYAQGVAKTTAILPRGWEARVIRIQNENTDLKVGCCLEKHDLAASKLIAGREKDYQFVRILIDHGLLDIPTLCERIKNVQSDDRVISKALDWVYRNTPTSGRRSGCGPR